MALDLDAIRARADAATDGPWTDAFGDVMSLPVDIATDPYRDLGIGESRCWPANAAFIAHARADIPALIDEISRLRRSILAVVEAAKDGSIARAQAIASEALGDG